MTTEQLPDANAGGTPAPSPSPSPSPAPSPSPSPSPAPSPSPTPTESDPQSGASGSSDETPLAGESGIEFKIPDAYKDKSWASKITSEEDLYKQLDTLDSLKGKKYLAPDPATATEQEIEAYKAATRPQDISVYQFEEGTPAPTKEKYGSILHKHGITAFQGNEIIKDVVAIDKEIEQQMYDPDVMKAELKKSFGDEWEKESGETAKIAASYLKDPKDRELFQKIPNPLVGLFYRMANGIIKSYGATENPDNGGGNVRTVENVDAEISRVRNQILDLKKRPHEQAEKDKLQGELDGYYRTKAQQGKQ